MHTYIQALQRVAKSEVKTPFPFRMIANISSYMEEYIVAPLNEFSEIFPFSRTERLVHDIQLDKSEPLQRTEPETYKFFV